MNKAIVLGHLGSAPELRYTQGGTAVTNFSIATNERWTDSDGEQQERTEWHRVVVWGRQAENCEKYLDKGSQILVEGRLQTNEWEDREGNPRKTTEIIAQRVQFLKGTKQVKGQAPQSKNDSEPYDDDDIPF